MDRRMLEAPCLLYSGRGYIKLTLLCAHGPSIIHLTLGSFHSGRECGMVALHCGPRLWSVLGLNYRMLGEGQKPEDRVDVILTGRMNLSMANRMG